MGWIFRSTKGSRITSAEADENTRMARDGDRLQVPKAQGNGLRIGPDDDLTFGWRDLIGDMYVPDYSLPEAPTMTTFKGSIKDNLCAVGQGMQVRFHIPHDYAMGTNVHVHAHWSHNSTLVTGGHVTWGFELIYAKGHNQGAFGDVITITEQQSASATRYQHMVCEAPASINGGSANLLDTSLIEVDGLVFGRVYLVANNLTVSSGVPPGVFLHQADIHYQSTGVATKNRAPNFWA